jgi:hypothetical protein
MAYKTCDDCGERVYGLGCTWCNEAAYITQQEIFDDVYGRSETEYAYRLLAAQSPSVGEATSVDAHTVSRGESTIGATSEDPKTDAPITGATRL